MYASIDWKVLCNMVTFKFWRAHKTKQKELVCEFWIPKSANDHPPETNHSVVKLHLEETTIQVVINHILLSLRRKYTCEMLEWRPVLALCYWERSNPTGTPILPLELMDPHPGFSIMQNQLKNHARFPLLNNVADERRTQNKVLSAQNWQHFYFQHCIAVGSEHILTPLRMRLRTLSSFSCPWSLKAAYHALGLSVFPAYHQNAAAQTLIKRMPNPNWRGSKKTYSNKDGTQDILQGNNSKQRSCARSDLQAPSLREKTCDLEF